MALPWAIIAPLAVVVAQALDCPGDAQRIGDTVCFFSPPSTGKIADGSAERVCEAAGAKVAAVTSAAELDAIKEVAAKVPGRPYIGAKRQSPNSPTWRWLDGTPWGFEQQDIRSECMAGFEVTVALDNGKWCGAGDGNEAQRVICSKRGEPGQAPPPPSSEPQGPYPSCIQERVVFRHAGAHAIFVDMTAYGAAGCWQSDCKNTDKFNAEEKGICARACAQIDECTHWSYGEQEGVMKCFLRKSDAGREGADGWLSSSKACAPEAVSAAFSALVAAELPELKACDQGKGDACPDMARAVRTWRFAIQNLKKAVSGQLDENTQQYVTQVSQDTDAFANQMTEENFPVIAGNNRQVFNALNGWLQSKGGGTIDRGDASLPNPLRGMLCGANSCYEK